MLGVPAEDLRKIGEPPPPDQGDWLADPEPWETPVDGAALAVSIKCLIEKTYCDQLVRKSSRYTLDIHDLSDQRTRCAAVASNIVAREKVRQKPDCWK